MNAKKLVLWLAAAGIATGMAACSSGGGSSGGGSSPTPSSASGITFDSIGTVPVFDSSSTQTLVFVHNTSNHKISGITYTGSSNVKTVGQVISSASASQCAAIDAGGSCSLVFTTPVLSTTTADTASALLGLSYTESGTQHQDSQIVNIRLASGNDVDGVKFASDLSIVSGKNGHGIVYAYGSGTGQSYTVNSLQATAPLTITQGDIQGAVIPSHFVQAIEVRAPEAKSTYTLPLTLVSELNSQSSSSVKSMLKAGTTFTSTAQVGVMDPISGAALFTSLPDNPIDIATEIPQGEYYVVNSGNAPATSLTVTANGSGLTKTTGTNDCGSDLAAGASCIIHYSVATGSPLNTNSWNGTMKVDYSGGATGFSSNTTSIYWYNSKDGPLVSITATPNPLIFNQGSTGTSSFTATNVGGYPVTLDANTIAASVVTGGGTATVDSATNTCKSGTLNIGGTCEFKVTVGQATGASDVNGLVRVDFTGTYDSGTPYTRAFGLDYTANVTGKAVLTLSPSPVNISVVGNGVSVTTQEVTVKNTGTDPTSAAPAISFGTGKPDYLSESNTCTAALAANASCTVTLKLGATTATNTPLSGTVNLQATYSGGTASNVVATDKIDYTVTTPQLVATTVTVAGKSGGNGTNNAPYTFNGSTPSANQSITITYQNQTGTAITIDNIQQSNLGFNWKAVNPLACIGNLAANATCQIEYQNILASNPTAFASAAVSENIGAPSFIIKMGNTLVTTTPALPNDIGNTLYATSNNAILFNELLTSTIYPTNPVLVQHSLQTNITGYKAITITSTLENYTNPNVPAKLATGCTVTLTGGLGSDLIETCSITPTPSGTGTNLSNYYSINEDLFKNNGAELHAIFQVNTNGQVIAVSGTAGMIEIGTMP